MHDMIVTQAMLSQVMYSRPSCVQSAVCRSEKNNLWLNVLQTGFKDHLEERQSFVLACFFFFFQWVYIVLSLHGWGVYCSFYMDMTVV